MGLSSDFTENTINLLFMRSLLMQAMHCSRVCLILKRLYHHIVVCAILLGLSACSTKKNTWLTRGYHRMNTRYNGYYYAREATKDGIAKIDKSYVDDYSNILPLFKYAQKDNLKMASGDMDKAIKKCTSAIERHMITDKKNVEIAGANSWISDCFLCIGKARFYKQEYFAAVDAFEYVTKKYAKWPIHYDGFLWLIRTYNETSIFSKSEELITVLKDDKKFPKSKNAELYALAADYNIRREQWNPAIVNLTRAIALLEPAGPLKLIGPLKNGPVSVNKTERSRYIYVLAQLYEKTGDTKKASELFAQVAHMRPHYDMEFNARLNFARLYDFSGGKGEKVKQQLLKMAKDFKNEDYRDQIYYTLAGIELREQHEAAGIDYLKKSVRVSLKNPQQKALSFLKLADLYYDKTDYKNAQAYYDSLVPLIKKDYPNYELIVAKDKNLTDLIKNLKVISVEDSLQRVAAMDSSSRNAFIDKLIAVTKAEEKRKEEEKLNSKNSGSNTLPLNGGQNANTPTEAGSWYFYNSAAISFGLADFRKKWGDRKLEDNWRRLSKESVNYGEIIPTALDQDSARVVAGVKDPKKTGGASASGRAIYLKNLPLSKDARDRSNLRMVDAYYNAGSIYKESLMNNPKSAATLEEMLSRFPENKYNPTSYYFLYRLYLALEDQAKAEHYRSLILTKFPDSELAYILKNPENIKNSKANADIVKTYYTETYTQYNAGNFQVVLSRCAVADSIYGGSKLSAKFDYLKAMSIGHSGDIKAYENALAALVLKYPKDPIHNQAQTMLDAAKRIENGVKTDPKADSIAAALVKKDKYTYKEDVLHYAVIVLNGKGTDMNAFKTNLSNFNQQYFSTINLTISSIPLGEDIQIVNVKEFPDKKSVMTYYEFVKGDKDVFKDISLPTVEVFAMSMENFAAFFHDKNQAEYKTFFNANYFKKNP
jgi:tetratricopeptide (TPR) repeat protein